MALLDIRNLNIEIQTPNGRMKIVDGVNLSLNEGEILGLVGESGSGKSLIAKVISNSIKDNWIVTADRFRFNDVELLKLTPNQRRKIVGKDLDFDAFNEMMAVVTDNARNVLEESEDLSSLKIGGLLKTTLLDYPGKVACTIFTSGCSYKCPFCHNRDLVYIPENYQFLDVDEIFQFLDKRKNILDGVCITGGEPLMQEKLIPFLKEIKKRGYEIKLDVTGNYLDRLKEIVDAKLVDYIAMDVKNTKGKYALTVGSESENFPVESIDACISYIRTCGIPYEFRTTIVRELHTKEDLIAMAKWLKGVDAWYLQQFQDSPNCIQEGFHSYNKQEMLEILEAVKQYVPNAEVRGVKED